jgi:hypothetical protein
MSGAAIARELRSARARLGWVNRRIRECEALAAAMAALDWRLRSCGAMLRALQRAA